MGSDGSVDGADYLFYAVGKLDAVDESVRGDAFVGLPEHADEIVWFHVGKAFEDHFGCAVVGIFEEGGEGFFADGETFEKGEANDALALFESHGFFDRPEFLAWLETVPACATGDGFCVGADLRGCEHEGHIGWHGMTCGT